MRTGVSFQVKSDNARKYARKAAETMARQTALSNKPSAQLPQRAGDLHRNTSLSTEALPFASLLPSDLASIEPSRLSSDGVARAKHTARRSSRAQGDAAGPEAGARAGSGFRAAT